MSLKCMIDKWLHKGQISQEEHDAVIKKLDGHDKQIRADAIEECISIIDKIMPPRPIISKSKHYENWKMKTTELRMLRDMLEQMQKGAENE